MRQATLCFLVKEGKDRKDVLLAMKKRGFGVGKWNGVGGKIDLEKGDKNIEDTAIRETEEEIGVKIKNLERVALLRFSFPYNKNWNQDVHVFLVGKWEGDPKESEEMSPKWFQVDSLPLEKMWDDDKFWVSRVLSGEKLKAEFVFKEGEKIKSHNIKRVKEV